MVATDDAIVEFGVTLDPDHVKNPVRPEGFVRGFIEISLHQPLRVRRLRLHLAAIEEVTIRDGPVGKAFTRTQKSSGRILEHAITLWGIDSVVKPSTWEKMPAGTYRYQFEVPFPSVNYPPSIDNMEHCSLTYTLYASIERHRKLSLSDKIIYCHPAPFYFEPILFPSHTPHELPFDQELTINPPGANANPNPNAAVGLGQSGKIRLSGQLSDDIFAPGDEASLAFHLQSLCVYPVSKVKYQVVQVTTCSGQFNGRDLVSKYTNVMLEGHSKFKELSSPVSSGPNGELIHNSIPMRVTFRIPEILFPCQGRQIIVEYKVRICVSLFVKKGMLSTNELNTHLDIPIEIVHVRPKTISPSAYNNEYNDELMNIENMRIVSYTESGAVPKIQLIPGGSQILPWSIGNPAYERHLRKQGRPFEAQPAPAGVDGESSTAS
ncbi:hypothetical protein GQ42DRAFT_154265 [Ramicandelaber brevisporus]|nr:hypothetical protein GQ42DRAFT_154265 [Ramicandelaber brevisporus]